MSRALFPMALSIALSACGLVADVADMALNRAAHVPSGVHDPASITLHDRLFIVDLHADTLMWHRGLRRASGWGQVDLGRLAAGGIGLQVFAIPTQVPVSSSRQDCTPATGFDPAPLLAALNGWPEVAWRGPHARALAQAEELQRAIRDSSTGPGPRLTQIHALGDLEGLLQRRRSRLARADAPVEIGALMAVEGAHAFSPDLGSEFDTLVDRFGLRMVGPMHHFNNAYGGSSEGCVDLGLTDRGRALVRQVFERRMILDLAHASSAALNEAVGMASEAVPPRPVLVSHTGIRSYLKKRRPHDEVALKRALSDQDILGIAGTGGTIGIIYWEDQIGEATVEDVVGTIKQVRRVLADAIAKGHSPGRHRVTRASQHISLGSDWDGAARNAIDAAHVAAITDRLRREPPPENFSDEEIADIMGRNACRVIAQSLSGGVLSFSDAAALCTMP